MERLAKVREILARKKLDGLFIAAPVNRNYLSGFTGSTATLLLTQKTALFVTDARYTLQAGKEVGPNFKIIEIKTSKEYFRAFRDAVKTDRVKTLGVEAGEITLTRYEALKKHLPGVKFSPESGLIEVLRETKSGEELARIRKAVEIAEAAFKKTLKKLKPGVLESEIAAELEYNMKLGGAEGIAFPTIVASGERGALPHGTASGKEIKAGELIVIDFGAVYQGYCSDLTRTVGLGIINQPKIKQYKVVYEAQQKAVSSIKSGVNLSVPDKKARNYLQKNGMEKYFTHGLGHGLGLQVHENPSISRKTKGIFKAGMVVTVEPGVYYNGSHGIRIENDVIVNDKGCELLGADQRKLLVL
ncbi:MAG: Xaa-Pro peptidase family protein [Candidatus Firestonebacteria bacterium]